jgi:hypothetical protein
MERNIKVFRVHRALYWFYLVLLIIIAALIVTHLDQLDLALVVPLVLLAALFLVHFVTARGAKACTRWGRICSMVIGVILLVGFPIGTIIGVYLLANTWRPWGLPPASGATA